VFDGDQDAMFFQEDSIDSGATDDAKLEVYCKLLTLEFLLVCCWSSAGCKDWPCLPSGFN
jgi:hypothetical protein